VTDEEAKKFRARAILSATKFGFAEDAEDFAQDVLLSFVSRPGTSQTIDQAIIDCIRNKYGRVGKLGHAGKYALATAVSPVDLNGNPTDFPAPGRTMEACGFFHEIVNELKSETHRKVITDYFLLGKKKGKSRRNWVSLKFA